MWICDNAIQKLFFSLPKTLNRNNDGRVGTVDWVLTLLVVTVDVPWAEEERRFMKSGSAFSPVGTRKIQTPWA